MSVVYFILVLSIIVIVHELGHLITAKLFGVYCYEFSIGMGPKIWGIQKNETEYNIRALPFGGFVRMAGEEDNPEDENIPEERRLDRIAPAKRIVVMLAGIFNNILTCIIFISLTYLLAGNILKYPAPVITEVSVGTPAEAAGMQKGDRIVKMTFSDGFEVYPETFGDVMNYLGVYHDEMTLELERGDQSVTVTLTPRYDEESERWLMGVTMQPPVVKEVNLTNFLGVGLSESWRMAKDMVQTLKNLLLGHGLQNVSGPVGIYNVTNDTMKQARSIREGFMYFFYLLSILSLNVGLFNLIPLPLFDGGRVVLLLPELFGKKVSSKVQSALIFASMALVVLLMVFVMYNDISKLFR